ncbi:MAG: PTS sugar transporter subunit IIA [Alphaproteobacteria bacterium]
MELAEIIAPGWVFDRLNTSDKSQLLRELSMRAAEIAHIDAQTIERALKAREDLGSTGMGQGIAIPHARIEGLSEFIGLFARLAKPIDFKAIDSKPIDLIFLLLIPPNAANKHVAALALISRRLRDKKVLEALRAARSQGEIYDLLVGPPVV